MHGHIMQLAYKLWRQVRIVGDLRLNFFIRRRGYLLAVTLREIHYPAADCRQGNKRAGTGMP